LPQHQNQSSTKESILTIPAEPPRYAVLLHNDDYTTMDFVVGILENIFHKPHPEAMRIMKRVHEKGSGVCGVYTQEIAEARVVMVRSLAEANDFPLLCTMEREG
jgi:ATP-dependent Clp protease adaptor protein ClpS